MALLALVLYLVGALLAFGWRSFAHWRRTGDTGLRIDAGPVGSVAWWAKLLFLVAVLLGVAGPIAGMAGLDPVAAPLLDHAEVRGAGLAVAAIGVIATLFAQTAMGASWRIGVDPAERTSLVTGGVFAVVRNPIFTAMVTTSAGLSLMTPNPVQLAATVVLVASIQLQVRAVEEPYLTRTHGTSYTAYTAQVGRFLPGIGTARPTSVG